MSVSYLETRINENRDQKVRSAFNRTRNFLCNIKLKLDLRIEMF